jgi:hypothetical protein
MNKDGIDTFLGLRCNFLLGGLANEWMARVGTTPDLANSAACKTLLPMIETALVGYLPCAIFCRADEHM